MRRFNLLAVILAVGMAACGFFIYLGISKFSDKDRCVTVKGLSEREVLANRVTWPMSITVSGDAIAPLYEQMSNKQEAVVQFLTENGITDDEISISSPNVTDNWESDYEEAIKKNKARWVVSTDITITTKNVKKVSKLLSKQLELRKRGIDVSTSEYAINYDYVDLAELKPAMVEEATKNARKVAEKFAEDANCELGSIMSATQGQFSIDETYYRPQYKNIRVVTTISYYLK